MHKEVGVEEGQIQKTSSFPKTTVGLRGEPENISAESIEKSISLRDRKAG